MLIVIIIIIITTKVYRRKKLKEGDGDLKCRLCHKREETIPHLLCQFFAIAQSLYKARHDRMLRPIYHQIISLYGFTEHEDQTPWHEQPTPKPSVENERAKILWDIPIYLDVAPGNGANKPDLVVLDKDKETCIIVEGTVCNTGCIQERTLCKQQKYTDLRSGLKRLYPNHKVGQVNIVLDFLGCYKK